MTDETTSNPWPLPKFRYSVQFGEAAAVTFEGVSGLDAETSTIEYRHGNSPNFSMPKLRGGGRASYVTLTRGVFATDPLFWAWYNEIRTSAIKRCAVVISLLDESGAPTMVWRLHEAWPTKISGTVLESSGNEVAVESIEVAFESMTVAAE